MKIAIVLGAVIWGMIFAFIYSSKILFIAGGIIVLSVCSWYIYQDEKVERSHDNDE